MKSQRTNVVILKISIVKQTIILHEKGIAVLFTMEQSKPLKRFVTLNVTFKVQ